MKTTILKFGLAIIGSILWTACSTEDQVSETSNFPTSQAFNQIRTQALDGVTQTFTLTSNSNLQTFTSTKGVQFTIDRSCLRLNGNPVTGNITIKFAEVFDGGKMLTTDKTTMGEYTSGVMGLIVSGGEFYLNATAGGQQLSLVCGVPVTIPTQLTGGADPTMLLWNGVIDADGNVDWKRDQNNPAGTNGNVGVNGQGAGAVYQTVFNQFGWTNVDRFYSDPRPKTTIQAIAPSGYDNTNSAIYLHYDGEGNALAKLDTYNAGVFSEHYGQIPIGLACHMIFATEDHGNWRYAIKTLTITANTTYTYTLGETTLGTQAQLEAAINALP